VSLLLEQKEVLRSKENLEVNKNKFDAGRKFISLTFFLMLSKSRA
jgi:hypothetical protein